MNAAYNKNNQKLKKSRINNKKEKKKTPFRVELKQLKLA